MPSRPRAFFRAGSPPPDGRLCREIALARSLRPSSSIGRFHGYRLELLAPVDVKPTRPWRVAIPGSRATDFKSEQKLNADDGRRGLTGHGSCPRDLQRRQLRRLKVLAGNRAPRRFVTRPRLQFPRSAAVPYLPPRNAGRSGSYANTACGSKLAGSTPSSPRRRQQPRDRSNNHEAHAAQTERISSDGTTQRKLRPCRGRAKTDVIARGRKPKNAGGTP